MNRYIIAPLVSFMITIIFLLIVVQLLSGCTGTPVKQSNINLINCIQDYKNQNPTLSSGLAYTYCSSRATLIYKKTQNAKN